MLLNVNAGGLYIKMAKYNHRVTIDGITYDSKFEHEILQETGLKKQHYHAIKVPYVIHSEHIYHPDFTATLFSNVPKLAQVIHFEAKGRFNFQQDLAKYKHIVSSLPSNERLVFIFQNPNTKIPGAKVRKDGSYLTNGQWANKQKIYWTTVKEVDEYLSIVYANILADGNHEFYYKGYLVSLMTTKNNSDLINIYDKEKEKQLYHGNAIEFSQIYGTIEKFIKEKEG